MSYWHWWIVAAVLLLLELIVPAAFFLWISVAAVVSGLLVLFFPLDWQFQLMIFSLISVVLLILSRKFFHKRGIETTLPNLNRRGEQYVGRTFPLIEAIERGIGKISIEDTRWRVRGPDLPVGTMVRVIKSESAEFEVEPLD